MYHGCPHRGVPTSVIHHATLCLHVICEVSYLRLYDGDGGYTVQLFLQNVRVVCAYFVKNC